MAVRLLLLAVALVAGLTAQTPAPTLPAAPASALDAKAVYLKTVAAVNALPLAPYVEFTSQNESVIGNNAIGDELHVVLRTSDGYAFVETLRNQDGRPAPLAPATLVTNGIYPSSIYRVGDFPLADFGLRIGPQTRPGIFEDTSSPEPEPSDAPRSIASVHVVDIPYKLTDLGNTTIAGHAVYHLGMTPVRDPGHHVLRQMWIDAATALPVRYVAERFVDAGLFRFRYLVTVNTSVIDGHLVNLDADGRFDVHRAFLIHYTGEGRWSISNVSFPSSEPPSLFEPPSPMVGAPPQRPSP